MKKQKSVKTLFYILTVLGILLILNSVWFIFELLHAIPIKDDFNFDCIPSLVLLFGITGWIGKEYAFKVKKDPEAAINSFNHKAPIAILLIGLSFTCNGQTINRYKADEFNVDSIKFIDLDDFVCEVDSSIQYHFCDKQPLDNVFIGDHSVLDLINNNSIDLSLEYKEECFRDTIFWYLHPDNYGGVLKTRDKITKYTIVGYENKRPSFPDFMEWIEKRKTK